MRQGTSDCARPDGIRSGDEAQSPDGLELAEAGCFIQAASRECKFHECRVPFKAKRPRKQAHPQGNDIRDGDWVEFAFATELRTLNFRSQIRTPARKSGQGRFANYPHPYVAAGFLNSTTSPPLRNWSR